jgi:hypothetical protein
MTSIHPGSSEFAKSVFSGRLAVGVKRGLGWSAAEAASFEGPAFADMLRAEVNLTIDNAAHLKF